MIRFLVILSLLFCSSSHFAQKMSGEDLFSILKLRSEKNIFFSKIKISTPERLYEGKLWQKRDRNRFLWLSAPAAQKGSVFLLDTQMAAVYYPDIERLDSFSDNGLYNYEKDSFFVPADVMLFYQFPRNSSVSQLSDILFQNDSCWQLKVNSIAEGQHVASLLMIIDKKDIVIRQITYLNDEDEKMKTFFFSEFQTIDNLIFPTSIQIEYHYNKMFKVDISLFDIEVNLPIQDNFFEISNIKNFER